MKEIRLPALDGYSALGILAALGTLRLLNAFGDDPARLSWSPEDLVAVLHTTCEDVDEVVDRLHGVVEEVAEGSVLPGVPVGFPPPGAAPDGLRLRQEDLRETAGAWLAEASTPETGLWLASLVTDLGVDDKGRVAISQYTAPSGRQSMSTMLLKPLDLVRSQPRYLQEALLGWRRVSGVTGEYLDHRATWEATQAGDGAVGVMRGVPGATWLALMSFPLFRTTCSPRRRPSSSGWHTVAEGRRRFDELRLPVWEQPLSPAGVVALVEHPALTSGAEVSPPLRRLGVLHVCRARRYQSMDSKSAGVLTTR